MLVGYGFLDELASGVPIIAAPDIRRELDASYTATSFMLLAAPMLFGCLLEPPLVLWLERFRRRRVLVATLIVAALLCLGLACASSFWAFSLAFGLWAVSAGVSGALAEALLVSSTDEPERALSRVGLAGMLGDFGAPLLMAAVVALGGSWRAAIALVALVYLTQAVALGLAALPGDHDAGDDEPSERLLDALRAATKKPWLWIWLGAAALCCLLDETLVAFGSLMLRDELGFDARLQSAVFGAFAAGGALGLAISDRWLARVSPLRVLLISALGCLATYVAWMAARSAPLIFGLSILLGAFAAPLHPIASARAYLSHASRPTLVAALAQIMVPFEVIAPLLVGVVADRFGILVALALLAVQPLSLALLAVFALRRGR